ncbi:MAG: hypothetical protein JWM64_416 [Frankiales bacterium]|nr:hypothetical protein [Frankiales bacterium]
MALFSRRTAGRIEPRGVCPDCGAALLPHEEDAEGSAGAVDVVLRPLPLLVCPSGHVRRSVTAAWPQTVLDAVRDQLPLTDRHPDCGHDRWAGPEPKRVRLQVSADPVPVRVQVFAPLLRCAVCHAPGLDRATSADVGAAFADALAGVRT